MRTSFLLLVLVWTASGLSALAGTAPLQTYPETRYTAHSANDGDSFMVDTGEARYMIRLYYIDCPEHVASSDSDKRRLLEQARYFGIDEPSKVLEAGRKAADRTRELLSSGSFTLYTAGARALGRSRKPRIYGMVRLAGGQDLGAVLVREGLARSYGVRRGLPDGTDSEEAKAHLDDLETAAAIAGRGLWAHSNPELLASLRKLQRDEERELDAMAFGVFGILSQDDPLDLNAASPEELQQIKGIGPVLAERIVQGRPYARIDGILEVKGIGPEILNRARPYLTVTP